MGSAYILDIDGDGSMDSLSDGVLIVRYMNGLSGPELVEGAVGLNSLRSEPMNILKYLDCINTTLEFNICKGLYLDSVVKSSLDIDGDGNVRAASDGMLLQRFLFGFTDNSLFEGDVVGENSTRGTKQILLYLSDLFLSEILDINADGKIDALSDGVLISRYMMGFLGLNLTEGVNGVDAQRFTPDKIVEYLDCLNTTPDFESCKGLYLDT